jgi:hypothetical protein
MPPLSTAAAMPFARRAMNADSTSSVHVHAAIARIYAAVSKVAGNTTDYE